MPGESTGLAAPPPPSLWGTRFAVDAVVVTVLCDSVSPFPAWFWSAEGGGIGGNIGPGDAHVERDSGDAAGVGVGDGAGLSASGGADSGADGGADGGPGAERG